MEFYCIQIFLQLEPVPHTEMSGVNYKRYAIFKSYLRLSVKIPNLKFQ